MILKNMQIKMQLILGFTILLFMVIVLGAYSYYQGDQIHKQTGLMFNHPLQVRKAVGDLNTDIVSIQRDMRDILLTDNEREISQNHMNIVQAKENAEKQIDFIADKYLGPKSDIEALKRDFIRWNAMREDAYRSIDKGDYVKAANDIRNFGKLGGQANKLLASLKIIENFADKKGAEFLTASNDLNRILVKRLLVIALTFLLLMIIVFNILIYNIRNPLNELNRATRAFHEGDLDARSSFLSKNEFGTLSVSFNIMAENLQQNIELNRKSEILERQMLSENDANKFFETILCKLCEFTGSQIAAAYLLSSDKKQYVHFKSIGADDKIRQSFSALDQEGELGMAIATGQVQHIKEVAEDTRFNLNTINGSFIPCEIVTIPVMAGDDIQAIISLASVRKFSQESLRLIDYIMVALSTRVEGILSFHKIQDISTKLESQNIELETQKTELISQSAMLREQNNELELQKKQILEASRLKTNFLSNMSHELRTPLNSVIALTSVLNRRLAGKIPKDEYSYLDVIERNGKNLLSLINDILDISRIESGRVEIEISRFNLSEQIAWVINMIKPQAREKKIELIFETYDPSVMIATDSDKFHHIMQNIISNAVKFTVEGSVKVRMSKNNKDVIISVQDTGIGISSENIPHIFDEFRQADSSTSRRYGGTGLGLAIARKYAQLLGGSIRVESELKVGSVFILTMPLEYIHEINPKNLTSPASLMFMIDKTDTEIDLDVQGKTILIVEDSEPAIIQIRDLLEETGFHVVIARNGDEALEMVSQTMPDAIILDLMMPKIDGFQVLKSLREKETTAHTPVLILTSKIVTKEELSFLRQNNIHQLIRKGDINPEELNKVVKSMIFIQPEKAAPVNQEKKQLRDLPIVLIVEDNPDNMLATCALLSDKYKVIEAVDGLEGINAAKKHKPDLILMDVALPGINGIEAFQSIRQNPELEHIPIIALTASAMASDPETILAYGFDAYIAKPIDNTIFYKIINETIYGG